MAKSVKDLAKWLKDEVEFLKENQDYAGGWLQLGNGLAAVVCWEEGWGEEKRDDCIQSDENPDYALVAGIKIYNPHDTPDFWTMLSLDNGDIATETTGILPEENYEDLAKWILDSYENLKEVDYDEDGVIMSEKETIDEQEKSNLTKETIKEGVHESPYRRIIAEHFDYTGNFDFLDIVSNIINRIEDFSNDEDIWNAIDLELIYTFQEWEIAMYYCSSPRDCDWQNVIESLYSDIYSICNKIMEEEGDK